MELLDLIIVFGIAFLSFIDIRMVGLPDGFIHAPALPPFRQVKAGLSPSQYTITLMVKFNKQQTVRIVLYK